MSGIPNLTPEQNTIAEQALAEAIKRAGGTLKLATHLRLSHQAVGQWKICPPLRVLAVSRLGGVPTYRLRPDLYPAPMEASA